jgi:hypothetical protein
MKDTEEPIPEGRWEWWRDSVWQSGQIFPFENKAHLIGCDVIRV